MGTDSPLYINMLGEFTLRYGENVISDQEGRSKKLWLLIEYLVTFRGKEISQNDLIDLLWPDDSNGNPANTLKTLVHRARTMVAGLEYENTKNIIIYRRGTYAWNDKLNMVVDLDVFEENIQNAGQKDISIEQKLDYLTNAISIYLFIKVISCLKSKWRLGRSLYPRIIIHCT